MKPHFPRLPGSLRWRRPRAPFIPFMALLIFIFLFEIPLGALCVLIRNDVCQPGSAEPIEVKIPDSPGSAGKQQ